VPHAWQLREAIREQVPHLTLGGWANPHADPAAQAGFLEDQQFTGEFFLTQVVSHHDMRQVERFQEELARRQVLMPGIFGVFYYRSANARTLETLKQFLPVPADALVQEFREGVTPDEICARTIRRLRAAGVRHMYVSNLPIGNARQTMHRVLQLAE
jgi:hypothetical protein